CRGGECQIQARRALGHEPRLPEAHQEEPDRQVSVSAHSHALTVTQRLVIVFSQDDYDREVKQAKEKQKHRPTNTPRRPRRPDRQVYHPRHQNGSEPGVNAEDWNESSSGTEQENTGTELFWLDYQADNGQITSFIVHKEDKPEVIVERVAEKNVLDSAMRAALLARVGQEMDKRCDKC
uniref:Chromosome 2 open reading frame 68 n=2 Tax=Cyprinus carpio TaxID=7962 RepID=A0A8C1E2D8_CYPCA